MNIIIATGCPHSGWEMVLLLLQQAGLAPVDASFDLWHDEVLQAAGINDPLALDQSPRPESAMADSAIRLLPQDSSAPQLLADSRSLWLLDFWAEQLPTAKFLLFYTRPEVAMDHAMLQGIEPQQFLQVWQTGSRQMLQFQRRHRRRVLLLDAEAACRDPEALSEICRRAGIPLQSPPDFPTPVAGPIPLQRLLAGLLVETQPAVQHLLTELEASAHPLGDSLPAVQPQPMELLQGVLARQIFERNIQHRLDEASEKLHAAQKEQDTQQQKFQVRFEELTKARDEQAKLAAERQTQLDQVQHDKQALTSTHAEAVKENELLLLQLHQVQEELEAIFLNKQKLEMEQKEKDQQLKKLREQIKQLTKDSEEQAKQLAADQLQTKVTQEESDVQRKQLSAQISQLTKARDEQSKLATARQSALEQLQQAHKGLTAEHAEAVNENELLLLQLHQVQEELETIFLQKQQLEQANRVIEKELETHSPDRQQVKVNDKGEPPKPQQPESWKMPASVRGILKPFTGSKGEKDRIKKKIQLLKSSGLFDEKWYLAAYPDINQNGNDPVEHYLRFGAAEGRDPSPLFNTQFYLRSNPDVAEDGANPLIHYIKFGRAEGRLTSNHGSDA